MFPQLILMAATGWCSTMIAWAADLHPVSPTASTKALAELKTWLAAPRRERCDLSNAPFASVPLTRSDSAQALAALWQDHADWIRQTRAEEMAAKRINFDNLQMKFEILSYTNRPAANGRSLFISMHGGGGAPAPVNESQWRNQVQLGRAYRPSDGLYLAPRAPTDDWNLWHQAHIDTFFQRIIENLVVFSNVNPNRVYILGYSAGGDGVYQLAPRMADYLAAAAMMAGHPNDASPLGLRNLPFAIQVGALDDGFKRNQVATDWGKKLDDLQAADPAGYVHFTELHAGKSHWMDLQDRKAIPWMEKYSRQPLPDKVVWHQSSRTHDRFYWLAVPPGTAKAHQDIVATRNGQTFTLSFTNVTRASVLLNDAMANLDHPVIVKTGEMTLFSGRVNRTITTLARTLAERGDTNLVFSARVTVDSPPALTPK